METLIIFTAKYLYAVIVLFALIFFTMLRAEDKLKALYLAVISAILAVIITLLSSHFIYDPRPFVVDQVKPLIPHTADNGFPSDHTLVAALASMLIFVFNKKEGSLILILSIFVGVSRVLAEVHNPVDIIGSTVIALVSILSALTILKRIGYSTNHP